MDATTALFTLWLGSFEYRGTYIGMAEDYGAACANIAGVRPTMDADFEVIDKDTTTNSMVRRNS